jgi:hypothetical protein
MKVILYSQSNSGKSKEYYSTQLTGVTCFQKQIIKRDKLKNSNVIATKGMRCILYRR